MNSNNIRHNPLIRIAEEKWVAFVGLITENVFALTSRVISKLEIQISEGGHYPAIYFV